MTIRIARAGRGPAILFTLSLSMFTGCGSAGSSTSAALSPTADVSPSAQGLTGSMTTTPTLTPLPPQVASQTQTVMATALLTTALPVTTQPAQAVMTVQPQTAVVTRSAETVIVSTESALAPETNPPGDIPDSQAFVKYQSAEGGYGLDVPEGWGRSAKGSNVTFVEKFNGTSVQLTSTASAPTATSVQAHEIAALKQSGRAVDVTSVKDVQLPGGAAVLVVYTSNSDPNLVTNKQVRLENNSYLFFKNGKLATLRLWAPLGADNVDQWQRMAQSFRWR